MIILWWYCTTVLMQDARHFQFEQTWRYLADQKQRSNIRHTIWFHRDRHCHKLWQSNKGRRSFVGFPIPGSTDAANPTQSTIKYQNLMGSYLELRGASQVLSLGAGGQLRLVAGSRPAASCWSARILEDASDGLKIPTAQRLLCDFGGGYTACTAIELAQVADMRSDEDIPLVRIQNQISFDHIS